MSVNFIFLLRFAGLFSFLLPQKRLKFLWSVFLFAVIGYALFSISMPYTGKELVFLWKAIPNLPVPIVFNPWLSGSTGVYGVLLLTALAIYYNIISQNEEFSNSLNGLIIFNSIFIIMAFCSANYIQLLAAVGMADVIVYGIINNLEAKRYYIYGNFVADFMLMSILALVLAQQGKVDIANLEEYTKTWHHRDFIAIILLIAVFIKSGFAFFHTAYQKMASLSFTRLNFILFASTPLMGITILLLLNNILNISKFSYPIFVIGVFTSLCWGFIGCLTSDDIKRKAIYNAMMFWGLAFAGVVMFPDFSMRKFLVFLISAFLFNVSLQIVCKSAEQKRISQIYNFYKFPQIIFVINMAASCLYALSWLVFSYGNLYLCIYGLVLILLTGATIASEIYLGIDKTRQNQRLITLMLMALPIFATFAISIIKNDNIVHFYVYAAAILSAFVLLFLTWPLRFLQKTYQINFFQKSDIINATYTTLIAIPVQTIGRGLRVAVDFIFLERTLIASIKNSIRCCIFIFKVIHSSGIWGKIFFIILGAAVFTAVYYNGVVR